MIMLRDMKVMLIFDEGLHCEVIAKNTKIILKQADLLFIKTFSVFDICLNIFEKRNIFFICKIISSI